MVIIVIADIDLVGLDEKNLKNLEKKFFDKKYAQFWPYSTHD